MPLALGESHAHAPILRASPENLATSQTVWRREGHLAFVFQLERGVERAMLIEFAPCDAPMKLHRIEIIGLHLPQAMLYASADILRRMNVPRGHARAGHASALRRQEVFRVSPAVRRAASLVGCTL